eukprot:GEMP01064018.1.p1 GENE.GEMP01064018.1~~GEMP01064018.1.p1  ORF type:complete len:174 (+),score=29.29 GEMP01064018.1:91-612(+)
MFIHDLLRSLGISCCSCCSSINGPEVRQSGLMEVNLGKDSPNDTCFADIPDVSPDAEPLVLRSMVKQFVTNLVRGYPLCVLKSDGVTEDVLVTLSASLARLDIKSVTSNESISVRLKNLLSIEGEGPPNCQVPHPLCTLQFRKNHAITFCFHMKSERDAFAKCIAILLLSHDP